MASLFYFPLSFALSVRRRLAQVAAIHPVILRKQRVKIWTSLQSLGSFLAVILRSVSGKYANLSVNLTTTALFAATIWFSRVSFLAENGSTSIPHVHFASGLAILRTLQSATSICTTFGIAQAFEALGWTVARNFGLLLPTFLALSPTTGSLGLLKLGFSDNTKLIDKFWSFLRYFEILLVLKKWG
jgi:hypothetical protein